MPLPDAMLFDYTLVFVILQGLVDGINQNLMVVLFHLSKNILCVYDYSSLSLLTITKWKVVKGDLHGVEIFFICIIMIDVPLGGLRIN